MYGVNTVNNISVISERTKSSVMKEIERKGVDINFDPKNKKRPMEILPYRLRKVLKFSNNRLRIVYERQEIRFFLLIMQILAEMQE